MFWQQMANSINLGTVLGISVERIAADPEAAEMMGINLGYHKTMAS